MILTIVIVYSIYDVVIITELVMQYLIVNSFDELIINTVKVSALCDTLSQAQSVFTVQL